MLPVGVIALPVTAMEALKRLRPNFRPGLLEPYGLSNAEELYWVGNPPAGRR